MNDVPYFLPLFELIFLTKIILGIGHYQFFRYMVPMALASPSLFAE